ncbi:MAG: 16S rRNA (uracil(1498)-N(3))-methyltransferase [Chloroflexi bacterium]|nr:16S rRNA (uracil(1498)-N(3))-methyltransferase [Chloroflexota bacterium]
MQRFFVPPPAIRDGKVIFSAGQSRQMRQVLRLQPGAEVLALDNSGVCYWVHLVSITKEGAEGLIRRQEAATGDPGGDLILNLALIRGERFEWVLQKGVELGVTHFQPMLTQRTVRGAPGEQKWRRWQRIIQEAAEQCQRATLPKLLPPCSFPQALAAARGQALMPVVAARQPLTAMLHNLQWPLTLYVGPEGGFAAAEVELAQDAGVHLVGLGRRILRSETAALVLATLALQALGEFDPIPLP